MYKFKRSYLLYLITMGFLSGCATGPVPPSATTPYPTLMTPVRQNVAQGQFGAAIQALQPGLNSDAQLYNLEEARIFQLQGDYADSINAYDTVISLTGQNLLGKIPPAVADNTVAYQVQPYQMTLAYQNQAIDYLAKGNIPGALIDFHRANDLEDASEYNYMNSVNQLLQGLSSDEGGYVSSSYPNFSGE